MSADYQRIERNIQFIAGSYRVLMTRRPATVYGGRFASLEEARVRRDGLESLLAARRQHHVYTRGRRATLEMERATARAELRRQRGLVIWLCVLALASGCAWLALGGGL